MTEDHVFLQADQFVDFACQCSFGQNLGGFLERCSGDKAIGLNRSLGDTEQLSTGGGTFWPLALHRCAAFGFDLGIGFFEQFLRNDHAFVVITVTGRCDLD